MSGSLYFLAPFFCTLRAPCALFSYIYIFTAFYRSKKIKARVAWASSQDSGSIRVFFMKIFAKVFEKQNSQHSLMVKMIHVLYPSS